MLGLLCEAIATKKLLAFTYDGHPRVVAPYLHGWTPRRRRVAARRAGARVEPRGATFAGGKLWTVSKMRLVRTLEERFVPDDPGYEPNDSAMVRIHCRV